MSGRAGRMGISAIIFATAACGRIHFDAVALTDALPGDAVGDAPISIVANRVFVSAPTSGALGGLAGADDLCQAEADAANLNGQFVALLSSSTVPAVDRLLGSRGWVRLDGQEVADRPVDVENAKLFYPITLGANGQPVTVSMVEDLYVWTGSLIAGSSNCNDWTAPSGPAMATFGRADGGDSGFALGGTGTCDQRHRIYCFELGKNVTVAPPPPLAGRIAFVTSAAVSPFTVAAADARCAVEATAATLPGTYLALVGEVGSTPIGRFDVGGAPWYRPDGALLMGAAQVASHRLVAAPAVHADRTRTSSIRIVAGASALDAIGTSTTSCIDWTSSSIVDRFAIFFSGVSYLDLSTFNVACPAGSSERVLCLQE